MEINSTLKLQQFCRHKTIHDYLPFPFRSIGHIDQIPKKISRFISNNHDKGKKINKVINKSDEIIFISCICLMIFYSIQTLIYQQSMGSIMISLCDTEWIAYNIRKKMFAGNAKTRSPHKNGHDFLFVCTLFCKMFRKKKTRRKLKHLYLIWCNSFRTFFFQNWSIVLWERQR